MLKCAAWGREVSYVPGWGRVHWREGRAEGQTDMVGRAAPPGQGREGGRRRGSVTMQFSRDRKGGGSRETTLRAVGSGPVGQAQPGLLSGGLWAPSFSPHRGLSSAQS